MFIEIPVALSESANEPEDDYSRVLREIQGDGDSWDYEPTLININYIIRINASPDGGCELVYNEEEVTGYKTNLSYEAVKALLALI